MSSSLREVYAVSGLLVGPTGVSPTAIGVVGAGFVWQISTFVGFIMELTASILVVSHMPAQARYNQAWQQAFKCLDVAGNVAEAKLASRILWRCPIQSVREEILARLCQVQPADAFRCGVRLAQHKRLSPGCLQSLLEILVKMVQDGKL